MFKVLLISIDKAYTDQYNPQIDRFLDADTVEVENIPSKGMLFVAKYENNALLKFKCLRSVRAENGETGSRVLGHEAVIYGKLLGHDTPG